MSEVIGTPAGHVNGWWCRECGAITYAVHVHAGVTPMFLACRAPSHPADAPPETVMARSLMYPWEHPMGSGRQLPIPPAIAAQVRFEWYRPDLPELEHEHPEVVEHVGAGGLLVRELTAAGRTVLESVTRAV